MLFPLKKRLFIIANDAFCANRRKRWYIRAVSPFCLPMLYNVDDIICKMTSRRRVMPFREYRLVCAEQNSQQPRGDLI